jgi:DHA1 family multidrug resistance protein-like MFS transporter
MPKGSYLIFCLIFIAVSFNLAATAALVPSIADYFGVAKSYAVRLTWLYMLPYSVIAFIWGPLSRKVTVKSLMLFSTAGFLCASLFMALSRSIEEAFVFRFLMGSFGSSFIPLSFITVGKAVSSENKARYLGFFFGVSTAASCIGVFLSGFIGWRIIYLIPAIVSLLICFLILLYFEDFDFRKEKFTISYLQTLKNRPALKLFVTIALTSVMFHGLQQNLGVYLSQRLALSQTAISVIFTVSTLSAIAARFLSGFFSATFGNIRIIRWGLVLMGIFALALVISANPIFVFLAVTSWGVGWALAHIGLSAYLAHMPDKVLRDASSINSSLRLGFGGLGALLGGAFSFSVGGFKLLFLFVAAGTFLLGYGLNKLLVERKESYG